MSAQISTVKPAVVKPFKLHLALPPTLEEEFATWDQLSDEALLDFEASLE